MEAGDLEDALAARLRAAGVGERLGAGPGLASAGLDEAWLDRVVATAGSHAPDAVRWLAPGLDIESLVGEIRNSAAAFPNWSGP